MHTFSKLLLGAGVAGALVIPAAAAPAASAATVPASRSIVRPATVDVPYYQADPGSGNIVWRTGTVNRGWRKITAARSREQLEVVDSYGTTLLLSRWSDSRSGSRLEVWTVGARTASLRRALPWRSGVATGDWSALSGDGRSVITGANRTDLGLVFVTSTSISTGRTVVRGGFPLESGNASAWLDGVVTRQGDNSVYLELHMTDLSGSVSRGSALVRVSATGTNSVRAASRSYVNEWSLSPNGRLVSYVAQGSGDSTVVGLIDLRTRKVLSTRKIGTYVSMSRQAWVSPSQFLVGYTARGSRNTYVATAGSRITLRILDNEGDLPSVAIR